MESFLTKAEALKILGISQTALPQTANEGHLAVIVIPRAEVGSFKEDGEAFRGNDWSATLSCRATTQGKDSLTNPLSPKSETWGVSGAANLPQTQPKEIEVRGTGKILAGSQI